MQCGICKRNTYRDDRRYCSRQCARLANGKHVFDGRPFVPEHPVEKPPRKKSRKYYKPVAKKKMIPSAQVLLDAYCIQCGKSCVFLKDSFCSVACVVKRGEMLADYYRYFGYPQSDLHA
jgi:hypothetical protein